MIAVRASVQIGVSLACNSAVSNCISEANARRLTLIFQYTGHLQIYIQHLGCKAC